MATPTSSYCAVAPPERMTAGADSEPPAAMDSELKDFQRRNRWDGIRIKNGGDIELQFSPCISPIYNAVIFLDISDQTSRHLLS